MGYIGAQKLSEVYKNQNLLKLQKGFYESMVHSVEMIKNTSNYKLWSNLNIFLIIILFFFTI